MSIRPDRLNDWAWSALHPHPLNHDVYGPLEPGIEPLVERIKEKGQQRRVEILPFASVTSDGTEIPAGTIIKGHRGHLACHLAGLEMVQVIERWSLEGKPMEAEFELLGDNDPDIRRQITDLIRVRMIAEMRKRTGKSTAEIAKATGTSKATVSRAEKIERAREVAHPDDKEIIDEALTEEGIRPAAELAEQVLQHTQAAVDEHEEGKKRRTAEGRKRNAEKKKTNAEPVLARETPVDLPMAQARREAEDLSNTISEVCGRKIKKIKELMGVEHGEEFTNVILGLLERTNEQVRNLIDAHLSGF